MNNISHLTLHISHFNMKYPENKNVSYPQIADEILQFWHDNAIFDKSITSREGAPAYTFYEGPPSANGTPGIHHVMARAIKDIFCRYKTLKGFQVHRKGGWDTHGLPVELQVEKLLGIKKDDIGIKISVEEYNKKCQETVMMYTDQWNDLTEKMGYWVDLDNPYITYEKKYIETLWFLLKELYKKGLLYKGYTVQPYSPAAGTGLSSHELNYQGTYQDVSDTSIVAQFKVIKNAQSDVLFSKIANNSSETASETPDVRILAWTTTPWTLPSNCALAVGENINYVLVKTFNPYTFVPAYVVLAKELMGKYFSEKAKEISFADYKNGDKLIPYAVLAEMKGKDLLNIRYEQLLPFITNENLQKNAFRVIAGDFVTTSDGTGIVHTASVFGADDFRVCQQNNVPSVMIEDENGKEVPIVDKQGKFVAQAGAGLAEKVLHFAIKTHKTFGENDFYVKNYLSEDEKQENYKTTDEMISIILKLENKAFKVEKYVHSYPHCWRTNKPILYYPLDSWFIKTTAYKARMAELNKTINWKPESTGSGRFGNWLENLVDWNLSRSRYWGTPLPIWRNEDGTAEKCIGTLTELKTEIEKANKVLGLNQPTELPDLHRPYVDNVFLVSDKGEKLTRETDLIDVWFDSGAMPYAQWGLLGEQLAQKNENGTLRDFPADFISEGVDQTRGWFFTLHALSVMLFDSVAYKNVVSTGLVLDGNGEKMSKTNGNAINPFLVLGKYGADATRWYMIENTNPWDNLKFSWEKIYQDEKGTKHIFNVKTPKEFYENMNVVEETSAGILEVQRKFFGTLQNTYNFYALYANVDSFEVDENNLVPMEKRPEIDRWIISKLQSLIVEAGQAYDEYEPTRAARNIQAFVCDHLSNWYVRLCRKRFWMGKMNEDKKAAYETLFECLSTVSQLMSPIAPFYADFLYKNLYHTALATTPNPSFKGGEQTPLLPKEGLGVVSDNKTKEISVHLTLWKEANKSLIDNDLEERMELAQLISSLTHALRKKEKLKVRQPLSRILLPILSEKMKKQVTAIEDLILNETNIKKIEYIDDTSNVLVKSIKPNFKRLGEVYKTKIKELSTIIQNFSKEDIAKLEREGLFEVAVSDGFVTLTLEEVLLEAKEIAGWSVITENGITVALDIAVSTELKAEGIARDFVNRIQNLRKEMNLEVTDKINVMVEKLNETVDNAILTHQAYIATEVQAVSFELKNAIIESVPLDMDDFVMKVAVSV